MLLTKDGITVEVNLPAEIARLKSAGYKEPEAPTEVVPEAPKPTPEEKDAEAVAEANKPASKKKGGDK